MLAALLFAIRRKVSVNFKDKAYCKCCKTNFQSRELIQVERLLPPNHPCCEEALLCAIVSLNYRVVADKRRITIHGEHFKLDKLATQWWDDYDAQNESYWTTQIYTNTKKGISATIQFDYRKRVRADLEYPDGR